MRTNFHRFQLRFLQSEKFYKNIKQIFENLQNSEYVMFFLIIKINCSLCFLCAFVFPFSARHALLNTNMFNTGADPENMFNTGPDLRFSPGGGRILKKNFKVCRPLFRSSKLIYRALFKHQIDLVLVEF